MPGQVYLVTTVCRNREPWFAQWPQASALSAALAERRLWRTSQLQCWVLMPDHLHCLVALGGDEPLAKLLQRVKSVTASVVNRTLGRRRKPVWAPGYHDHGLRREEDVRVLARYIVANPLRAGLVERIGDYPYWDATWLQTPADLPSMDP